MIVRARVAMIDRPGYRNLPWPVYQHDVGGRIDDSDPATVSRAGGDRCSGIHHGGAVEPDASSRRVAAGEHRAGSIESLREKPSLVRRCDRPSRLFVRIAHVEQSGRQGARISAASLRLRRRVVEAANQGVYVSVMLFEGWAMQRMKNAWLSHPFHPDNNINGIDGDRNGDGRGLELHTLGMVADTPRPLSAKAGVNSVAGRRRAGLVLGDRMHFHRFLEAPLGKLRDDLRVSLQ